MFLSRYFFSPTVVLDEHRGRKYGEAIREFREAARLQPDLLDSRNNLGVALGRSGDYNGARREWEEVLKIDPNNEAAHRNLDQLREMGR